MRDIDVKSYALGYDSGSKTGGGYPEPSGTKNISSNGDYNIKDYATAHVDVPQSSPSDPDLVDLTVTENGTYTHTGHDGYDEVVVNVPQGSTPTGTRTITQNGVYNVTEYASADVQVEESIVSLTDLNATANGTYNHAEYDGYDQVVVNVPNTYSNSDEGKVVHSGALVSQSSITKTANGTYDTTLFDQVIVNVPNPSTGTLNITSNGDYNVRSKASAHVAVPNSYALSDEDKVVHNGALVTQSSATKTSNGTYDTTLNNEIVVNVPQGITPTGSINITSNGTKNVTNYASAIVNVPNTYSNSDEGKVLSSGALVAQTGITVESNGTYDTTTNNEVVVNVSVEGASENTLRYNRVPFYGWLEVYDPSTVTNRQYRSTYVMSIPARSLYLESCHLKNVNGISAVTDATMFTGFNFASNGVSGRTSNNSVGLVTMPQLTTITTDSGFWNCFPNATILGPFAYAACTALTTPVIPPNLSAIREYAFYYCESMQSITLPSTLRSIYEYAFSKCANLLTITIPENIYLVGSGAFSYCSRLQTVIFEGKPTKAMDSNIFYQCQRLTDIYVPWSSGEVAGAPWGATNATVHYNYSA